MKQLPNRRQVLRGVLGVSCAGAKSYLHTRRGGVELL